MKFELVDHWRLVLRRSAVSWATAIVNSAVALVGVHWAVLLGVLPFLPFYMQLPLALLVAAIVTAPTIVARITKQPKLNAKLKEKSDVG